MGKWILTQFLIDILLKSIKKIFISNKKNSISHFSILPLLTKGDI